MFTITHRLGLAAAVALAVTGHAQTQIAALKLDELTITATRTERPVNATPGTINVVDLRDSKGVTLDQWVRGESLVSVPFAFSGAGVAYQRSGAQSINIRGVSVTNVAEQQRRTEPGLNATLSARLTF